MAATFQSLMDRASIIAVVTRHATSIDQENGGDFGSCFAGTVELSMPVTDGWIPMTRDELVGVVSRLYAKLQSTQHISANHQITISGTRRPACPL